MKYCINKTTTSVYCKYTLYTILHKITSYLKLFIFFDLKI